MSLFTTMNVTCPSCGQTMTMEAVGSVNADRRPDLREAILENVFQQVPCVNCGANFRLEPEFSYLDVGNGQWIAAMPARRMVDFREIEPETQESFDSAYGKSAPLEAQAVGEGLTPRLTFGWQGLREKILLGEEKLDDGIVELCKLEVMRNIDEAPVGEDVELRLYIADESLLTFLFLDINSEETLEEAQAPRALYDEIAAKRDQYGPLLDRLTSGPFVDMRRLYMGEEQQPQPA
ncbi:CpXC domain-containing protein [Ostreiculturibacter nitratireducens]|uniref:CpXC domain-containing protein n=1 Tax=Ostreiculturibacter nitratireducens TaxID=3075226 RepID=UPI0031B64FA6